MGQVAVAVTAVAAATDAVLTLFDKWKERFKEKPERAPPPPPREFNISQEDLIRNARDKLKMDVINNYNFALCGPRGTGKSTFINCIRQLDDPKREDSVRNQDDQKAAPVGITETTDKILPYKFPPNRPELQRVVLWDMPGSGTVKHPLESYFEDKVLYAFDCLLITCDPKRFGEEQLKIIEKAQKYKTPVVLLITMLEQAVDAEVKVQFNQERRHQTCRICPCAPAACWEIFVNCIRFCTSGRYQPTLDELRPIVKQTIEKLKSYAQEQLNIVPESRIFVISAEKFRDYYKSAAAGKRDLAKRDLLRSGEMAELIQHLCDEASRRRN